MRFALCSATRNTFIFTSAEELKAAMSHPRLRGLSLPEIARLFCRSGGSGADGFVVVNKVESSQEYSFKWDFYNRDGSSAEMCGNAARCMGFYVLNYLKYKEPEFTFQTLAGLVAVKTLSNGEFSVRMPEHQILRLGAEETVEGQIVKYSYVNTGVPHAVIETDDLNLMRLRPLVKVFRFHSTFGPAGANVSFFSRQGGGGYSGVTFERGVEDFTASCGTGVVAMALSIFSERKNIPPRVDIQTPGGALKVDLDASEKFCWLIGAAGLDEEIHLY